MTQTTPRLRFRQERWRRWVFRSLGLLLIPPMLFGGAVVVAVGDRVGPTRAIVDAIDQQIGDNESLRYDAHRIMGKILSFCACTAGLSREQYRRAEFHRPHTHP